MTAACPIIVKNIAKAGFKIKMNASKPARYIPQTQKEKSFKFQLKLFENWSIVQVHGVLKGAYYYDLD